MCRILFPIFSYNEREAGHSYELEQKISVDVNVYRHGKNLDFIRDKRDYFSQFKRHRWNGKKKNDVKILKILCNPLSEVCYYFIQLCFLDCIIGVYMFVCPSNKFNSLTCKKN